MTEDRRPSEPCQRWRIAYAREASSADLEHRDEIDAWRTALASSGLPLPNADGPRGKLRVTFGPPLARGMTAEHELLDITLVERCTATEVKERVAAVTPVGHRVVDVWDVWVGAPALVAQVVAADYLVTLGGDITRDSLESAARTVLAKREIRRERPKGDATASYDLRPLVVDVRVAEGEAGTRSTLSIRTRLDPALGTGRPEEVVAELEGCLGRPLDVAAVCRQRLILTDD
jgi:radical SAM-linked protein